MRQVRRGPSAPAPGPDAPPYGGGVPRQPQYVDGQGYDDGYDNGYDSGYNTGHVYGAPGGPGGPQGPGPGPGRPRQAPNWRRRIKWTAITLVTLLVVVSVGTYFWADSKLHRDVDLSKVIDRPEAGEGTNYLIVGSDSRAGMSAEDKKKLHTGSAAGKRTDSMMILHTGSNGSTLVSLPRDSDVEIPTFKGSDSGKTYQGTGPTREAERGLRRGRPRTARAHRRVQHRPAHRPLHGDRLRRLREDRRRGRRCRDEPRQGLQGQVLGRRLQGGQADAERRAGPGVRPDPARVRRLRPGAHQEPAEVPGRPGPPGGDPVDGAEPVQALPDHGQPASTAWSSTRT